MRVLVLATDAFGGTGGIAQYIRDFVAALASYPSTTEVVVIPRVIAREPEPLPPRVTNVTQAAGSKRRFITTALRTASRKPMYDWVICAHVNLLPIAHAAAAISGSRIILLVYGMEVWEKKSLLTRQLVARTRAVAAISKITIERMKQWAPTADFFLLPNAIDLDKYTPGPANAALVSRLGLEGRRVLLTLGRMDAREQAKGFDEILEIMPQLGREFSDVVYVAAGEGSDRARLQAKARELGIEDRTVFPGYVPESEKLDYYRLADVFVMPSRLEGFGYVFLEALAMQRPVIASKIDGGREAVREGEWGLLVDPGNQNALLDAIRCSLVAPMLPGRDELELFSRQRFDERAHRMLDSLDEREVDPGKRPLHL